MVGYCLSEIHEMFKIFWKVAQILQQNLAKNLFCLILNFMESRRMQTFEIFCSWKLEVRTDLGPHIY